MTVENKFEKKIMTSLEIDPILNESNHDQNNHDENNHNENNNNLN